MGGIFKAISSMTSGYGWAEAYDRNANKPPTAEELARKARLEALQKRRDTEGKRTMVGKNTSSKTKGKDRKVIDSSGGTNNKSRANQQILVGR